MIAPSTSNTLTKTAADLLGSFGSAGEGIFNDIFRGAGPNYYIRVLNDIVGCPALVLWAHGEGLLQTAAAVAGNSGASLCDVLPHLHRITIQPVTPFTLGIIQSLRPFGYRRRGWSGRGWSGWSRWGGLQGHRGTVGSEISHAGERLQVPAAFKDTYRDDIFYRTGAPGSICRVASDPGCFQGPFPYQLALCWGQAATSAYQLLRIWRGDHGAPAQYGKLGENERLKNKPGTQIPDSQPGDIYAIPKHWGDPPTTKSCWAANAVNLGQAVISSTGEIHWFPYGTPIDCGAVKNDWVLQNDGNCAPIPAPVPPLPTPCPTGQIPVVKRGGITPECQPIAVCDPATQDYDPQTNTCKPKVNVQPPVTAAGGSGWLILAILVAGGLGAGLYINEHGKHKGQRPAHAGIVGGF